MSDLRESHPRDGRSSGLMNISDHLVSSITITANLHTEVVVTTKDKISNALFHVLPKFRRRTGWVAPATLLSSLVIALLSTDFNQNMLGLSAETWKAMFTLAAGVSALWLVWALVAAIFFSAKHKHVLDAIVKTHNADAKTPIPGTVVSNDGN